MAQGAALMAMVLAGVAVLGWVLDIAVLTRLLPRQAATMSPDTAVAVLSLGLSLIVLIRRPRTRMVWIARFGAILAAGIGALSLVSKFTGVDLGLDHLKLGSPSGTGVMAPATASAVLLGGFAAFWASIPRLPAWTSQILGLAVLALGLLRLYGFAYDVSSLEPLDTALSLPTAMALALSGLALFLRSPDEGAAGLVMNAGTTGVLGRWMLSTTLVASPLLGWAAQAGEDAGLFTEHLATALLVWGHVCVFTVISLAALTVGSRVEVAHAAAQRQVQQNEERYEQQRRIAYTLQQSLMGEPPSLPRLPSARRYLPSAQEAGVGGDWFDVIPLDESRTGVVIGDVMGRGLEAAAVMGQLRAAAHALAMTDVAPHRLMTALDTFVGDLADQLVTCCYLLIDQDAQRVTVCSAGHLPVIVVSPEGAPRLLRAPVTVPLGVGSGSYEQISEPVPAGSTLALYTDGLIERPGTDIYTQIDVLADTLGTVLKGVEADPALLERAANQLVATLLPDTIAHDDDVTLLLLRLPEARPAPHGKVPASRSVKW
ncbi:PP2C family protein-serine/threonine phosphatase [Streptomyces sp. NPDC019990]|uniref:PP2C family protein-serine/threonine phosphatase n=1 Tax=Streptomyces sp. NPDC019990 TaxID=3154693 RepID=UPI0033E5BFDB